MTEQFHEPEVDGAEVEQRPGFTLVEVHMRLFLDEDGDIDHETYVERTEGNLPPEYAVLGAWELAKDTIKAEYEWADHDCDCWDCEGGGDCEEDY